MVRLFSLVTWGGSIVVLLPAALALVVLFRREDWWRNATFFLGGVCGASVLANVAKQMFARPRPDVQDMLIAAPPGFSFPSAHAAQVFAFATACFVVFGRQKALGRKSMLYGILGCGAVVVAFSRVYLRVHFLSDVIAGAILGISWVLALTLIVRVVEKRK